MDLFSIPIFIVLVWIAVIATKTQNLMEDINQKLEGEGTIFFVRKSLPLLSQSVGALGQILEALGKIESQLRDNAFRRQT